MIEAPPRPTRKSLAPQLVDQTESVLDPRRVIEVTTNTAWPQELLSYILDHQLLLLCERPSIGTSSFLHDLLKDASMHILVVTDEPATLLQVVDPSHLLCDADERYCRSKLVDDAFHILQSHLASEQAELDAEIKCEEVYQAAASRVELHKSQTAALQELAEQRVRQSPAWLQHLAGQEHQARLQSQIASLNSQLTQPVGFLQRLLGRGTATELQKQLDILEADLLTSKLQSIPEADLFQTLLAAEFECLQKEAHVRLVSLQTELEELPVPKRCQAERQSKQLELNARLDAMPFASEEYVWTNRRVVVVSRQELFELDRPGHFDKWILDVSEATPELVRHCNRLGRSGLLIGDVPTLQPPRLCYGSILPTLTFFENTWNELVTDCWALEDIRLIAQSVCLSDAQRADLKAEPIIGTEEHEARLHENGNELILAEVAFAPGTDIAQATKLLIEQPELACLSTLGEPIWTTTSCKHMAQWLTTRKFVSTSILDGSVELGFYGVYLTHATFDAERFPTHADAEKWLTIFLRCSSPLCLRTRIV